jgi:hypothetical protein
MKEGRLFVLVCLSWFGYLPNYGVSCHIIWYHWKVLNEWGALSWFHNISTTCGEKLLNTEKKNSLKIHLNHNYKL